MLNNIKTFGLNVIPEKQRTIDHVAQSVENAVNSMWEPLFGYLEQNDNVFSGQVLNDIEKINNHTMRLGMSMNSANTKRNLNYES